MSETTVDTYTETKTASQLFTMPLDTCDFSSCSIVQSDGTACPQAALSKASTQTFTLTRTTTNIQLTQQCKIVCTPTSASVTVSTALFDVKIDYDCSQSFYYSAPSIIAEDILQNSGLSNSFTKSFTYNSMIQYQPGYTYCSILSCQLYSFLSSSCQWNSPTLSETWIIQTSALTQLDTRIDTSTKQSAKLFCVQCTNSQAQTIQLTNKISIQVYCLTRTNKAIDSPYNSYSYIQMPTHKNTASDYLVNPTSITLDITNYFDSPIGVCTYTSCDIVDASDNLINWITGASLSGSSCTFSVSTTSAQAQKDIYLKLTSSTASPLSIKSQVIKIEVVDACLKTTFYDPIFQSLQALYQQQFNTATDTFTLQFTASQFFKLPLSTCDFSSCSLVKLDGTTACPQATITKASSPSSQTFSLERKTTQIQEQQQCFIKCTPNGGSSTVQTAAFDVKVFSQCQFESLYSAKTLTDKLITYYQFNSSNIGVNYNYSTSLNPLDFINFPPTQYGCNQYSCVITAEDQLSTISWINYIQKDCQFIVDTSFPKSNVTIYLKLFFYGQTGSNQIFHVFSQSFKAQINESCSVSVIRLSDKFPDKHESMASDYYTEKGYPRLIYIGYLNSGTIYKAKITQRFDGDFIAFCPLTNFTITKVINKADQSLVSDQIWQNIFEVSNEGIFQVISTRQIFTNFLVYIQARNSFGKYGGDSDYLIDATIQSQPAVSIPPYFEVNPTPINLQVNLITNDLANQTYQLPKVSDDTKYIKILPLSSNKFLSIDLKTLTIDPTKLTQKEIGVQNIVIVLMNSYNVTANYTITINFKQDDFGQMVQELPQLQPKIIDKTLNIKNLASNNNSKFINNTSEQVPLQDQQNKTQPKNMTGKISKISLFADMEYLLNDSIIVPQNFNYSWINETNTILSIVPAQYRDQEPGFDASKLKFTWKVVNITENKVVFKLNFTDPSFISPLVTQDQLNLTFNGSQYFLVSSNTGLVLHQSSWTFLKDIKPQMKETEAIKSFLNTADQGSDGFQFMFLFGLLLNILGASEQQLLFGMIRALQLVLHLPIMQTVLPPNASAYFKTLIPIVMFDTLSLLPEGTDLLVLLKSDEIKEQQSETKILSALRDLGYQKTNALTNLTVIGLTLAFYYFKMIVAGILKLWLKLTKERFCGKRFYKILTKNLFFNDILGLSLEAYIEFLIASYLCLSAIITTFPRDQIALAMSIYMATTSLAILPAILSVIIGLNSKKLKKKSFKKRFEALYEGIDIKCRLKRAYFLMYCVKRFLFVFFAFYFQEDNFQGLQLILLVVLNFISMIYIGSAKAFERKLYNIMDIINESFTAIISLHMFLYTYWVDDKDFQTIVGWSMIIFVTAMLVINLGPILYYMGKQVKLIAIKYFRIIARWVTKTLLADSFQEAPSPLAFIQKEKERIRIAIENPQQAQDEEICAQLAALVQHEANLFNAKMLREEEREQRKQDYEEKREKVIEEQSDFQKKFLEEAKKLGGRNLLVNKIVDSVHILNKQFAEQQQQEQQANIQNQTVNPLKIGGILHDEFMQVMRIPVPELEQLYQNPSQNVIAGRKRRKKYVKIHLDAKSILQNLNMPEILEEPSINKETIEFDMERESFNQIPSSQKTFKNIKKQRLNSKKNKEENRNSSKEKDMNYLKGSIVDRFGNPSRKSKNDKVKQQIPFQELPLTFKEWEKIDNLFTSKNGNTFKNFLQNHYKCLFDSDFKDLDWTQQHEGSNWDLEKKKFNIRGTIAQIRNIWIFDSESDATKLNKFRQMVNLMQIQLKQVKGKQKVPAEMTYNLGVSALASQFKIPRKEFVLLDVPLN